MSKRTVLSLLTTLRLELLVRDLNETFRLGLLEDRIPPLALGFNLLGHCIIKIQKCVRVAIAVRSSVEILEMY